MAKILDILQETTDGPSDALVFLADTLRAFAILFAKEGDVQKGLDMLAKRLTQKLPDDIREATYILSRLSVTPPAKGVN